MMINRVDLERLTDRLTGRVLVPSEAEFASVRKWFIGNLADTTPRAVVRCGAPGDVVEALSFARTNAMPFAIRSGGHSFAEYSMTDGLLIDVGDLDDIQLSRDGSAVTVGPGVRIGPLAEALAERGRVVPFGWCPMVAVAGATMGGGFGPLARYHGLACDHLVAAELVVADGEILQVAQDSHPDLLWALRGGGGGNFGAVTSLTYRTRESRAGVSFAAWWRHEDAPAVVDGWQQWACDAPNDFNAELVLRCWPDPDEPPIVVVFGLMIGLTTRQAGARVDELVDFVGAPPVRSRFTELSAVESPVHHTFAGETVEHTRLGGRPPEVEPGIRLVKSEFFEQSISKQAVVELIDWMIRDRVDGQQRELEFIPWGGAIGSTAPDETAFVHRGPRFLLEHTVQAYGPIDLKRASHEWVTRSKSIVHPFANGHVYQNYPDPDLADWAVAYYGANLDRLCDIKARYDPDNLFDFEQSIGRVKT